MQKVIVIGCPGSGKSTFSRVLHAKTGLPLVYLDRLFWNADRTHVSSEVFRERVLAAMESDSWIIDGNYGKTLEARLQKCDRVFFLDYPLELCLAGVAARMGKERPDMPWIETEPDPEFLEYIRDFVRHQVPEIRGLLSRYPQECITVFHNRSEADRFLAQL